MEPTALLTETLQTTVLKNLQHTHTHTRAQVSFKTSPSWPHCWTCMFVCVCVCVSNMYLWQLDVYVTDTVSLVVVLEPCEILTTPSHL